MRTRQLCSFLIVTILFLILTIPNLFAAENVRFPETERGTKNSDGFLNVLPMSYHPDTDHNMFNFLTHRVGELATHRSTQGTLRDSGLNFGTAVDQIKTINGTVIWTGWDGSFSETYTPSSETYAWVVYYGYRGMFVALQWAKSHYSSVDVFMGLDSFCGGLTSPDEDSLSLSYIGSLNGVSISFDTSLPVFSGLGIGASLGTTFFRKGESKVLEEAIQFSQSYSISYSLTSPIPLPSLPFSVALDYESGVETGFYPVVDWSDIPVDGALTPLEFIIAKLKGVRSRAGENYLTIHSREMASIFLPYMETLNETGIGNLQKNGSVSHVASKVEEWLQAEDADELGQIADAVIAPLATFLPAAQEMGDVQGATQLAFELGYKYGYDSSGRDNKIYADCLETVHAIIGETCTVAISVDEISSLVLGSNPADFKDAWVYFDTPPDEWYSSESKGTWIQVSEDGKATYEFVPQTETTFFMGILVEASDATGNKTLELCLRKVIVKKKEEIDVDIRINDADGPLTITEATPVSISLGLNPVSMVGVDAEWWIYADTTDTRLYWVYPTGWQVDEQPTILLPIMKLPLTMLISETFPAGDYTFHFSIDTVIDGDIDESGTDAVSVLIQ